ncbi:unnamed protein product [Trifolium pratense]|uniref:Uncharacterized protein n=1 Tax=Trifolium pratense TaxID=57577 RepID=A0ACB0JHW7_TRIPR|nr:unnamed protein product [Trifolium pratense]
MRTSSIERCTTSKNELGDLPESEKHVYGAMLPVFLNDLRSNHHKELVEITLELEDNAVVLRNIASAPNASPSSSHATGDEATGGFSRSLSIASRIRKKFPWLRSLSMQTSTSSSESVTTAVEDPMMARNARRMRAELERTRSSAQRGLKGLRFISKSGEACEELWRKVEKRADSNEDGRITREEVQELIMLSASANNLSKLKEQAEGYAALIMEELDPENLGYIELWQLEMLLLEKDRYMTYSRQHSSASVNWSQNMTTLRPKNKIQKILKTLQCLALEYWRRGWILLLWFFTIACLFVWKFYQYKNRTSFEVMSYCLPVAKGAAETLKFNMALLLLPVCRNTLTWLRSTKVRKIVPFDDNINFHKMIAFGIVVGIVIHAGNHLACDFPLLVNTSPEKFSLIASDFNNKKPTYKSLLVSIEGITGITMVTLMIISFTLATSQFRRNAVNLPSPLNRLTGFNAFWYSHHLLGIVYVLLFIHGSFLNLTHKWYQKTTWMYISVPLLLYIAERTLRTRRSQHYAVKVLKVSVLPGNVFSLIMSKPNGFKYKSGQYIFLQCPKISPFEWHPFSITSAPGDEYLSVHIRTVGDWTQELKHLFTEDDQLPPVTGQATFRELIQMDQRGQPKLFVDGPYGAPAQDYQNFDVLLLIGLGIGATPFISILRDILSDTRTIDEQTDSNTETTKSDESFNSFTSSNVTPGRNKRSQRITNAYFYWVTREPGSFEWFKGVMDEVAEMDHKGLIELHNYLTSVYEEGDARSTLITMIQALNHAKHGVDILSGTRVRTHFARPDWKEVFTKIASKHPNSTVGVFYCGMPMLAKELKKLSLELSHKTTTRFEFHKEYF